MRLAVNKLFFLSFLLLSTISYSQSNTVFVTSTEAVEKGKKVYERRGFFSQFTAGMYFVGNGNTGKDNDGNDNNESPFIPDGLKAHAGFGAHFKEWVGISANTGIDWQVNPKLVFTPVYGSLFVNPHFGMDSSFLLEAGYGWSFALGRGDLSGFYQKYRLGYINDDRICIFAEYSRMEFQYNEYKFAGGLSIGLSIYNLL